MTTKIKEATPTLALHHFQQKWLFEAADPLPPENVQEFLERTMAIMDEWYRRWSTVHEKIDPSLWSQEARDGFLRENSLKALATWHVLREIRVFWLKAGLWVGDPYDPDDKGTFTVAGLKKPMPAPTPPRRQRRRR